MDKFILNLPRAWKWALMVCFDVLVLWVCLYLSFYIRLLPYDLSSILVEYWLLFALIPVCVVPIFVVMNLYQIVLRYVDYQLIFCVFKGSAVATVSIFTVYFLFGYLNLVPRSVPFLYFFFSMVFMTGLRFLVKSFLSGNSLGDFFKYSIYNRNVINFQEGINVAIFGAGTSGRQLLDALNSGKYYNPIAFIDDDDQFNNRYISGVKVFNSNQIERLLIHKEVKEILLAIPSASRIRKKEIIQKLEKFGLPIKTMPSLPDIASGRLKVQEVQDIDIGDLLGRVEVEAIPELLNKCIDGKNVLVTGAGGSIGSELCRQIVGQNANLLVLFEVSEFALYSIDQELKKTNDFQKYNVKIIPVLGSINDHFRLLDIMNQYEINTVYHAAAYKHVPLVEYNLSQGIRNNVMGTLYVAQAAILANVERFVLISTDKAVRPTNIMGASKRLAEMILQSLSKEPFVKFYKSEQLFSNNVVKEVKNNTCFTMVRFGNVLGSSGSVIPIFRDQIKSGGPITVTHPEICRYFMTIPEASQLVIQAGSLGQGGEVFVLDMGKPIKIIDLAKKMIQLSGFSVKDEINKYGDIEIKYTGLRPGEKLYEELLIGNVLNGTSHSRIFQAKEEMLPWNELCKVLDDIFESINEHDYNKTRSILLENVNGYCSKSKLVDWLFSSTKKSSREEIID